MNQVATDIQAIVAELFEIELRPEVSRPEVQFGDATTNVAMQLAGRLKQPPRQIAEAIAEKLKTAGYLSVEVAGPGFINLRFSDQVLISQLDLTRPDSRADQTIVIETNNPNPFKAMHIGHAYNSILADTIANLIEASGARVHRVSYHGDVGLHVGKSMYSLLKYADGDFEKIASIPESEHNNFMSRMYAQGSLAYKEEPEVKKQIDDLAAQSFKPQTDLYAQIYDLCKAWSFKQIELVMNRLHNQAVEKRFLESETDSRGVKIVHDNTPQVFKQSDGAYIFEGSKYGSFDNAFVSSNGRGLYAARDLGLIQLKDEYFHPDYSYIVTGKEQQAYFKGVIAAAAQVWPDKPGQTINISNGLVKLSTGKMSSRDGNVIEIAWLFDEFRQAITERGGQPTDDLIAGALRYQFLKVRIGGDVVFDINEAVSLTGNTGSYLQYAYARASRIIESAEVAIGSLDQLQPEDKDLVRKLGQYQQVLDSATANLEPHLICSYLFELAQEFNRYYEQNRVLGSDKQAHRLALVASYQRILKSGLEILGMPIVEKM